MKAYKQINKCRICNSKKLINIVNLNDQYLQGSFIKKNIPKNIDLDFITKKP